MNPSTRRSRAHRWLPAPLTIALIAASMLIPTTSAAAEPSDMVLEWNLNAVNTISNPTTTTPPAPPPSPPGLGQPPPLSPIHLAMVHGAIYDAVQAIVDTHEPYIDGLDASGTASQAAAVAAAAYGVLDGLAGTNAVVKASLLNLYEISLAKIPAGTAKDAGIDVGEAAATAMLEAREGDGRFGTYAFPVPTVPGPGEWRPIPNPGGANVFAWISLVTPFTLDSADQYRIGAPYPLSSPEYAADFNEVKTIGGSTSVRTPEQTAVATWASVNPFPMLNKGLREMAAAKGLSTSEQARLFVMTSMSTADSLIACWENKDHWLFWRPQTAIQLAATDGNPATVADPSWTSLAPNPGYPDPPSGFNCLVSGAMNAARAYFKTNSATFSLTSANGVTRDYRQFSGVIRDAINGRVYIGIHFRRADVQGAWLGNKVSHFMAQHYFQPID